MPFLEIKALSYTAGDKKILDEFCLSIGSSEVHALLGTNGTGKSTLAYVIMGCEGYRLASGEIIFNGREIRDLKIHERAQLGIAMAWQEPVRFEGINVRNYLTLKSKEDDPSMYLEMVGLHPELYLHRMVDKSLSGGERKRIDVKLENNVSAHFIAHCIFPKAEKVKHIMDAVVDIGEGAEMKYSETHYHRLYGGIEVIPKAIVKIAKNGRYFTDFTLITGRVGKLGIDYSVEAGENAVTELNAKIFGHANDDIKIREEVLLQGDNARGLIRTRVAIEDEAKAEITGITEGNAAGARGHVDCMEIVKDRATARAIPIVNVRNPLAKVTHEAAIGSVDKKQLETLMAHGLSPEEAVDVIVKGILR